MRSCPAGGSSSPVPGNAEAVLEQMYGTNWPVPDQGFDLARHLQRSVDHLLTEQELDGLQAAYPDQVRVSSVIGPAGDVVPRPRIRR